MQISIDLPDEYIQNPEQFGARAESIFLTELTKLWRQYLLPAMRKATPYRTGQLRRSLHIVRDKNKLIIAVRPSGFYWHLQRGLPAKYKAIADRLIPQMTEVALIRTREKIGL